MDKELKVLILNGSPKNNGNTMIAVNEMVKVFDGEGIETEVISVGNKDIRGCVHGNSPGQAAKDLEGLQTIRVLAGNMAFLMKSIALGKEKYGLPEKEERQWTHFIDD